MILGCTATCHADIKKTKARITLLQYVVMVVVVVIVVVVWHVFSMQTAQAEKTIQICTGSQR
jgi:flagellar basal body-associated protein FliL